ncbi:bifunctional diaminohydroxyphosphoribosylaminopyrimidine deaminase/5-amino-6-(5-phosphoribosylamino)uracil reductase RibD [Litoribrevibacter albus]|uniref:Riboflavin biosynthesis protein RibD n=1 Tax=Litoribrevibacter albus TaxID=1473156 RepID=A0AA37WA89_9GAMM|nr:bifunctional diaminohydroxyphosphoribosylaminopyrimidine deaminase/5-amino-6-(5-phosphoribosylamino)uracil reductase RibD [Litoribrevibacter albus]GLQ33446.1 riboflavin biosynthesis protein RibD [Litoribrevibacter albus]
MINPEAINIEDEKWMSLAIELAQNGLYTTHPNPRVGCVIVKDDQVVGQGFHFRAGEPHAEVHALKDAGEQAKGATAYVTLEPCSHFGRTPPCCDALIKAGVSRVVAAMTDPNPEVAGRGLQRIEEAGISVVSGILEDEARDLNPGFLKRMETGLPYVRVKQAMSLDGRTAMASGESKWITGPAARSDVQRLRAMSDAIITGVGSILHDDSSLTLREDELGLAKELAAEAIQHQPLRVVLDSQLSIPEMAKILSLPGETIIVCSDQADQTKKDRLEKAGVTVWTQTTDKRIQLVALLKRLAAERSINEVLVEAGAQLSTGFLEEKLVDECWTYIAPKLMGADARPLVTLPLERMNQAIALTFEEVSPVGEDLRIISKPAV